MNTTFIFKGIVEIIIMKLIKILINCSICIKKLVKAILFNKDLNSRYFIFIYILYYCHMDIRVFLILIENRTIHFSLRNISNIIKFFILIGIV
jgi:hypothetical protein